MRLSLIFGICCAVALGVQVYSVAADEVPTYDVRKTCKTDTQAYQGPGTATLPSSITMNKTHGLRSLVSGRSLRRIPNQDASKRWATLLASKAMSTADLPANGEGRKVTAEINHIQTRRRGDRIGTSFAAVHASAIGT